MPDTTSHRCLSRLLLAIAAAGVAWLDIATAAAPPSEVRDGVSDFYAAYLGRPLTDAEADAVAAEFIGYYDGEGCSSACRATLTTLGPAAAQMRDRPHAPETGVLRQSFISRAVFGDSRRDGIMQRLLLEPDPPAISNAGTQRLMTEGDLAALVALAATAQTGEPVRVAAPTPLAAETRARLIAELEPVYGHQGTRLPIGLVLAAELYAGLATYGDDLSADERRQVARFALGEARQPISAALIDRVLGVGQQAAAEIYKGADLDRAVSTLKTDLHRNTAAILGANREWSTLQAVGRAAR